MCVQVKGCVIRVGGRLNGGGWVCETACCRIRHTAVVRRCYCLRHESCRPGTGYACKVSDAPLSMRVAGALCLLVFFSLISSTRKGWYIAQIWLRREGPWKALNDGTAPRSTVMQYSAEAGILNMVCPFPRGNVVWLLRLPIDVRRGMLSISRKYALRRPVKVPDRIRDEHGRPRG